MGPKGRFWAKIRFWAPSAVWASKRVNFAFVFKGFGAIGQRACKSVFAVLFPRQLFSCAQCCRIFYKIVSYRIPVLEYASPRARVLEYSRSRVLEYSSTRVLEIGLGPPGRTLGPKVSFSSKSAFWAPKCDFGAKTAFGHKMSDFGVLAPSGGRKSVCFTSVWGVVAPGGRKSPE